MDNPPSISKRLVNILFLSQSFYSASQIAVLTLVAIVAVDLSGREDFAGLPTTTVTFSRAFLAFPFGLFMGRMGRRFGLSVSYSLGAIGGLIGVFALIQGSFIVLLLSAMFLGMSRAGAEQSRFAAGEMFPENMQARMIGRVVLAGTVGAIGGPILVAPSSTIALALGLPENSGPWLLALVFLSIATILTFILLRPDPMEIARELNAETEKRKREANEAPEFNRPIRELFQLPNVQLALLAMLISQTVMVVLMVMTPLHMDHHNHSTGSISLVISAHTLGMFGLSSVTGYLIDRYGITKMLITGAIVLIISALLAPLTPTLPVLSLALFLLGLGWNFGYVAGSTLLSQSLTGAERGRIQGLNDTIVGLAAGFGALSAGPLFSYGGYSAVSLAGLLLTFLLIVFIWQLTPKQKHQLA